MNSKKKKKEHVSKEGKKKKGERDDSPATKQRSTMRNRRRFPSNRIRESFNLQFVAKTWLLAFHSTRSTRFRSKDILLRNACSNATRFTRFSPHDTPREFRHCFHHFRSEFKRPFEHFRAIVRQPSIIPATIDRVLPRGTQRFFL